MKRLFYCLLAFSALATASYANTGLAYGRYGYKDPSRKDYYDDIGQHQGYSKKDRYSDRTNHYDAIGQGQGYSQKDRYSGEIRHYDAIGQYQGSTR